MVVADKVDVTGIKTLSKNTNNLNIWLKKGS